jgi:outer membrane protein assembly factor BamB
VVTNHKDNMRSAVYSSETVLTPANVNSTNFGKVNFFAVDGKVDAQPLYLSNVSIGGVTRNVLYVVTEHGSAYAFDADTGAQLWKVSTLGVGESPSDPAGCTDAFTPEIGISATPVIDRTRGPHGALYLVAMSKTPPPNPSLSPTYFQRIHALDVATGAELFGGPQNIVASVPGSGAGGSSVSFDPFKYAERAALLMVNGVVYTTWSSHCDQVPYWGWIIGFDAATLQTAPALTLNITPNGTMGGIWMAGSGPAADNAGAIYLIVGNGTFDETLVNSFPVNKNFGNAYLKLSTTSGSLAVADYFTPYNTTSLSQNDADFGSGGALLLPDLVDNSTGTAITRHLAVGAGKDSNIFVLNRDSMGKFSSSATTYSNTYQTVSGALAGGVFSKPTYFNVNGTPYLYYGAVGDRLKAFQITNARISATPSSQTTNTFGYPGTTPSISANGIDNGIVWAVENNSTAAILHAYNATNLAEIYNSNLAASSRDQFGPGNKFIAPIIANGRVYVGTQTGVAVFGLLP